MGSESKQWSQTNQQRPADISTSLISPHCINSALPSPCLRAACPLCPPPYSLSRNPLWSVVWQQLHCVASQKPINQLTTALSCLLYTHKQTLGTNLKGTHKVSEWAAGWSVYKSSLKSNESINDSGNARKAMGRWKLVEEEWCQGWYIILLRLSMSALYLPNILQCRSVAVVQAIERLVVLNKRLNFSCVIQKQSHKSLLTPGKVCHAWALLTHQSLVHLINATAENRALPHLRPGSVGQMPKHRAPCPQ